MCQAILSVLIAKTASANKYHDSAVSGFSHGYAGTDDGLDGGYTRHKRYYRKNIP